MVEHPGCESLGLAGQPEPAGAAGEQVATVLPQAQVHVTAVADPVGRDLGREGGAQAVLHPQRTDGRPHQHGGVGGVHRRLCGHRQLELSRGVLRMELLDRHPLVGERDQQVPAVVARVGEPGQAVRRTLDRGRERAALLGDHPLDLDRRPYGNAAAAQVVDEPAQQLARVKGVRRALLVEPLARRPGPARLGGQDDEPLEVGQQPQVTYGARARGGCDEPVVEAEEVEGGGAADAPGRQVGQPVEGDALDPRDAGVVDEAGRDRDHPLLGEVGHRATRQHPGGGRGRRGPWGRAPCSGSAVGAASGQRTVPPPRLPRDSIQDPGGRP